MGASQSTGGGATPGGSVEVKTSYYELLGVERTATQDEIKKAYRRKALELHPDRNYGDVERTTALFADIQSAHQVLSDEQERAWYDAHEGDILRGGSGEGATEDHYQGNMRVTTADDLARMMGKFRGKVDFSDSPNGFFGYVRETFEQLAREEEYAADYEGIDIPSYPSFGHKDDDYEDVVRDFYAAWNGFATAKSFAWLDVYRLSDAPDRRFRRAMEKENQKCRDDGRRDFNDAVRTLIAFVRKRDPRYTPNRQSDEDKANAARAARKAQAARSRAAHMAKLEQEAQAVPSWATERPADEEEEEEEEEVEEDIYECVACSKTFKSERQYEAHEKSKKHQKAIQSLKKKMRKDNAHLNLDEDALASGVMTPAEDDGTAGSEEDDSQHPVHDLTERTDGLRVVDDYLDNETDEHSEDSLPDEIVFEAQSTHATKPTEHDEEDEKDDDDEYASRSEIESRLACSTADPSTPSTETTEPTQPDSTNTKLGKAAQKRAKKAAKLAEEDQSLAQNKCLGCDAAFPSKSQLHQHLQDHPKHAALKTVSGGGKKKGKRK